MSLEYLDTVYKQIFSSGYSTFIIYAKALAAIIILIQLSISLYKSFSKTGNIFTERENDGFSPYELLRGLGLVLIIILSTQVLDLFDSIMVDIENIALKSISELKQNGSPDFFPTKENFKEALAGVSEGVKEDNNSAILRNIIKLVGYFNPLTWIGGSMAWSIKFILSIVDMFIYPFFLSKRYFIMGIIKLFFPILIAFSIFEKTKDFAFNALKLYARAFLTIIPMVFVVYFVDFLHFGIVDMLNDSTSGAAAMAVAGSLVNIVAVVISVVLKIALFKQCFTLMDKLIP